MKFARIVLLLLLVPAASSAARVGMKSLLVDPGVAATGMAYAYTAVADDPSAIYWNVAGLSQGSAPIELLVTHSEWLEGIHEEYAVAVYRYGQNTFAAGISGLWVPGIERREEDPLSEPLGDFAYYDLVVPVAYARSFGQIHAGLSVKPWYSKLDRESAYGTAVDFGVLYEPKERLRLGAALSNLGSSDDFIGNEPRFLHESFDLPLEMRAGVSYAFPLADDLGLLVSGEVRTIRDDESRASVGAEVTLHEDFSIRGGYKNGYDSEAGYAFGFSARRDFYALHYAVAPLDNDFGTSHRFGVSFAR